MMSELVSIIIPCYNAENYVAEAIQSALDQTHDNCEVIVVDDGSSDGSVKILKGFGEKIRWVTQPNRGGCAARNTGIEMAQGGWIQFLDADDVLTNTCVEDKIMHSDVPGTVMVSRLSVHEGYPESMISTFWQRDSYDFSYMLRVGTPQTSQPLHKTENLRMVGGFNEELPCANEYDLHLRLSLLLGLRFEVINTVGVHIRPLPGSLSRRSTARMSLSIAKARHHVFRLLCRDENHPATVLQPFEDLLIPTARKLWHGGMSQDALWLHGIASQLSKNWWKYGYGKQKLRPAVASLIGFAAYERLTSVFGHSSSGQ
jgi:glycosyltransferase involved in cell wall biosynthesis